MLGGAPFPVPHLTLCLQCAPGYSGQNCSQEPDACQSQPCHNHGTCTPKPGGFRCVCPPGFVGLRCEGAVNQCLDQRCHPRGTAAWNPPQPPAVPAFSCLSHQHCPTGPAQHHTLSSALLPVCSGFSAAMSLPGFWSLLGCCFLREAPTNWPAPRDGPACPQLPVDARELGPCPTSHSPEGPCRAWDQGL